MDEAARTALEAELKEVLKRREQLDVVIAYLNDRLGGDALPTSSDTREANVPGAVNQNAEPAASVRDGEFFGMSSPEATRRLLEKFGRTRPMKTDEIWTAITKGGVKIQNAATLYRSLTRDEDFLRVGRGTWGLAEWYPPSARRSVNANGDDAPNVEGSEEEANSSAEEGPPAEEEEIGY